MAAILAGIALRWAWVRNFWFRTIHLAMIAVVVAESLCGIVCPLTDWEDRLREAGGGAERARIVCRPPGRWSAVCRSVPFRPMRLLRRLWFGGAAGLYPGAAALAAMVAQNVTDAMPLRFFATIAGEVLGGRCHAATISRRLTNPQWRTRD